MIVFLNPIGEVQGLSELRFGVWKPQGQGPLIWTCSVTTPPLQLQLQLQPWIAFDQARAGPCRYEFELAVTSQTIIAALLEWHYNRGRWNVRTLSVAANSSFAVQARSERLDNPSSIITRFQVNNWSPVCCQNNWSPVASLGVYLMLGVDDNILLECLCILFHACI